jgi:hypothetical protein
MLKKLSGYRRLAPTVALVSVVLLASYMGNADGGYFVSEWGPAVFVLAVLLFGMALAGIFKVAPSRTGLYAVAFFTLYTVWTFLSLAWAPNRGDAWLGAGQTLLYLLAFWVAVSLITAGASRRWALTASVLGPALIAGLTLLALDSRADVLFYDDRLVGSVGYYNGEAAFLLVPLWVSIYLVGSKLVHPVLRALVLAGAVVSMEVAVLTQSRGAMVAIVVSLPVYFLFSGQRLRGALALAPLIAALFIAFPDLNNVYAESLDGGLSGTAVDRAVFSVWLTASLAGLYGLVWGFVDGLWRPPARLVRATGGFLLAAALLALLAGGLLANERVGNPVSWGEQKWEAFKTNDVSGQQQSRYLSASGTGRYTLWQVAWKDFTAHPLLGVGTHNYEATYYQLREGTAGFARQPHMLPLEVLAERGVVGGVLFFGFLAACLVGGLWRRFGSLGAEGRGQVGAVVAAVVYWFAHSSADWFWQLPAVSLPVIVYLAVLASPWGYEEPAPSRWPLRVAGAGVAVLALAVVVPLFAADRYAAQSTAASNPWVALAAVERAQRINPVDPYLPQREAELALRIGDWPRVEDAYRRSIRLNPEHYAPYELLGLFYEEAGEPKKALPLYRKASALNPLDQELEQRISELRSGTEGDGDQGGSG